ncbi:MAG: hypothetical protein JXR30_01890, partial [Alphaproteobacteria bacterium]|nr:hypothetical protein [Alphaproteobacteria bacterium]
AKKYFIKSFNKHKEIREKYDAGDKTLIRKLGDTHIMLDNDLMHLVKAFPDGDWGEEVEKIFTENPSFFKTK